MHDVADPSRNGGTAHLLVGGQPFVGNEQASQLADEERVALGAPMDRLDHDRRQLPADCQRGRARPSPRRSSPSSWIRLANGRREMWASA